MVKTLLHLLLVSLLLTVSSLAAQADEGNEQHVFDLETLTPYDGAPIHAIRIQGLKWTKEAAVRWLLSQHEGDLFQADRWVMGIHKLYDTRVLYNINTTITRLPQTGEVDIEVSLTDRWALMPFGIVQAGGGSGDFGGGVYHANFLGYFAQVSASYSQFDQVSSYDFNIFQEFYRDTDYIWGLDLSKTGTPVSLQTNPGDSLGKFIWQRDQLQFLFGKKLRADLRLFSYFELFHDQMISNKSDSNVDVSHSTQYRLRPTLILGRSELTNFLEQGQEITFAPTSANFFSPDSTYSTMVFTYKRVFLSGNTNYGFFVNTGAMTHAPVPYLFRLGGYDSVRGFATNRAIGQFYATNSLEYRPYLFRLRFPLIGEIVTQGNLFADNAVMANSNDLSTTNHLNSRLWLSSVGTGLRFDLMQFAGAIGRIDFAQTLTPREGFGVSLGVGQFF